jgi:integrase
VASVWIHRRRTAAGKPRYHVEYRAGGRGTPIGYAGSFKTVKAANERKAWVYGELAALRMPNLVKVVAAPKPPAAPTFAQAAERWRESRVDVADSTRIVHRTALNRALPVLGALRLDEITTDHVVDLVAGLVDKKKSRESIRKTITYTAAVLDEANIEPNPVRDKRVRLPYEEDAELCPPEAEHVEAVYRSMPSVHRLPLLFLDWSGARVSAIDLLLVSDYDEPRQRVRLRREVTKTKHAVWVDLPPILAEALSASLGPREDRDRGGRLFPGSGADAFRTSLGRACEANAVPEFSPHGLRHRRISVLHRQGKTFAEIARFVGQKKLSVTADNYTHVLVDGCEIDIAGLLG